MCPINRKQSLPWMVAALCCLLAGTRLAAQSTALDDVRSAWQARRMVTATSPTAGMALGALALPPEVGAGARADLADLRLLGPNGDEVPYVIDRREGRDLVRRWEGTLADRRSVEDLETAWTIDFGEPRTFDALALRIDQSDFTKRLRVEASDDNANWRLLAASAGIFDTRWSGAGGARIHHTTVELAALETARYVRLTADDAAARPIAIAGVAAIGRRALAGERWTREAPLSAGPVEGGTSRWTLDVPGGLPLDRIALEADDAVFWRRVRLEEEVTEAGRTRRETRGEGQIYRLAAGAADSDDGPLAAELLWMDVTSPAGKGPLFLVVENGDSPPLRGVRATLSGTAARLIFTIPRGEGDAAGGVRSLTLYYGNPVTRAPHYDLAALEGRLRLTERLATYALAPETRNPSYREAAPLTFLATAGAALDGAQWEMERALTIPEREDIYSVALAPADLSLLRGDFGDVRVVDHQGRQVPYLLQDGQGEHLVPLQVAAGSPSDAARGAGAARPWTHPSIYRLEAAEPLPGRHGVWMKGLQLDAAEPFFQRNAALSYLPADNAGEPLTCFSGVLMRAAGGQTEPLVLPFRVSPVRAFTLVIEEGDNAPLTIRRVQAVVPVWNVVVKLAPQAGAAYRLLLGNPRAERPRYDIEALRREVLAYSAVPAAAGALRPNPDFKRGAFDWARDASSTFWIWGALMVAVAVLLGLTVRLLKKP